LVSCKIKKEVKNMSKVEKAKVDSVAKRKKERNDYTGPLQGELDLSEFSKDFLLKIVGLWEELWTAHFNALVMVGAKMEGVGPLNAANAVITNLKEVAPPYCRKIADLCKADVKTVENHIMSGRLYPDDLTKRDPSKLSKEFILKCMRLWGELWEANNNNLVKVGALIEAVGPLKAGDMVGQALIDVAPSIFRKIADVCKVDVNTIEGRIKSGRFIPDNLIDHYTGARFDILNNKEATLTYDRCIVVDAGLVGDDINILRYCCDVVEPQVAMAYMNYPGERKVTTKMLKLPESLPPKPGEPICIWHFKLED
jgi:hypothetical protein